MPVPGYEGYYEANALGEIFSISRKQIYSTGAAHYKVGQKLKPVLANVGYLVVGLNKNGDRRQVRLHIIIAKIFVPNPSNRPHVNHLNGNKLDPRASNLEWCTPKENMVHASLNDLTAKGDRNGSYRLSYVDIEIAYEKCSSGEFIKDVAQFFDVSVLAIQRAFQRANLYDFWMENLTFRRKRASIIGRCSVALRKRNAG